VTATNAKKDFGKLLEAAIRGRAIVITKHSAPKAVLISIEEFHGRSRSSEIKLDTLTEYFDRLLDRMQRPKARAAMQAAFDATPEQLGRAAVAGERRRK
jgi:prevent-host-death family protein